MIERERITLTVFLVTIGVFLALLVIGIIIAVIVEYPSIKKKQRRNKEEWDRKQAQKEALK